MISPPSLSAAPFPSAPAELPPSGAAAIAARLASAVAGLPGGLEPWSVARAPLAPALLSAAAAARAERDAVSTLRRPAARRAATTGYAKAGATSSHATTAAKTTTAKTTAAKTTASTTAKKSADPLAFLSDKTLSVEEKLFRFMCAMAQKYDDALEAKMNEIGGRSATGAKKSTGTGTSSPATQPKKKSGILGALGKVIKAAVPGAGTVLDLLKMKEVQGLLKTVSGPVLAAGATALGFPQLAPLLLKAGPDIANVAVALAKDLDDGPLPANAASAPSGTGSAAASSASASGSTGSAQGSGESEQVQMLELQRLQEKQREMFSMVTNVLRSMHETKMAMINNLRA